MSGRSRATRSSQCLLPAPDNPTTDKDACTPSASGDDARAGSGNGSGGQASAADSVRSGTDGGDVELSQPKVQAVVALVAPLCGDLATAREAVAAVEEEESRKSAHDWANAALLWLGNQASSPHCTAAGGGPSASRITIDFDAPPTPTRVVALIMQQCGSNVCEAAAATAAEAVAAEADTLFPTAYEWANAAMLLLGSQASSPTAAAPGSGPSTAAPVPAATTRMPSPPAAVGNSQPAAAAAVGDPQPAVAAAVGGPSPAIAASAEAGGSGIAAGGGGETEVVQVEQDQPATRECVLALVLQQCEGRIERALAEEAVAATEGDAGNRDADHWAEAACCWLAMNEEGEEEAAKMRDAMAASLAEAEMAAALEAAAAAERDADDPFARFGASVVLAAMDALVPRGVLLAPPLRDPLLELLQLEQLSMKWYGGSGTAAYFALLSDECAALAGGPSARGGSEAGGCGASCSSDGQSGAEDASRTTGRGSKGDGRKRAADAASCRRGGKRHCAATRVEAAGGRGGGAAAEGSGGAGGQAGSGGAEAQTAFDGCLGGAAVAAVAALLKQKEQKLRHELFDMPGRSGQMPHCFAQANASIKEGDESGDEVAMVQRSTDKCARDAAAELIVLD